MRSSACDPLRAGIQLLYKSIGSLQFLLHVSAQMGNASSCIITSISKLATDGIIYVENLKWGYLPNTAVVMVFICRFKPVSSSATGLSAPSASSALFCKVDFSGSQSARSLLKPSFSFCMAAKALVSSSLPLEVSACWDLMFSSRSAVWVSFLLSSAYKRQTYHELAVHIWSTKHIISYAPDTWGLMHICLFSEILQVPSTIQVLLLALGG